MPAKIEFTAYTQLPNEEKQTRYRIDGMKLDSSYFSSLKLVNDANTAYKYAEYYAGLGNYKQIRIIDMWY